MAGRVIMVSEVKTVTTAGTRVALSSSQIFIRNLVIQANPLNSGNIFVGGSNVASTNGVILTPGASFQIEAPEMGMGGADDLDLSDIYIDSAQNNDTVRIAYLKHNTLA